MELRFQALCFFYKIDLFMFNARSGGEGRVFILWVVIVVFFVLGVLKLSIFQKLTEKINVRYLPSHYFLNFL